MNKIATTNEMSLKLHGIQLFIEKNNNPKTDEIQLLYDFLTIKISS